MKILKMFLIGCRFLYDADRFIVRGWIASQIGLDRLEDVRPPRPRFMAQAFVSR